MAAWFFQSLAPIDGLRVDVRLRMLNFRYGGSPVSASRCFRSRKWMVSDLGLSLGGTRIRGGGEGAAKGFLLIYSRRWFTGNLVSWSPARLLAFGLFGERVSGREYTERSLNPMGDACMK